MTEIPKLVAQNIDQFTGRTWLLPHLLEWWDRREERFCLLVGAPGSGKSMILAWLAGYGPVPENVTAREQLARLRARVKAVHFCIAASGSTDPKAVACQIAKHLTRQVPGFGAALAATLGEHVKVVSDTHTGPVGQGGSVTGVFIAHLNLGGLSEELSFNRILRDPLKRLYEDGYDQPMLLLIDSLDEALTYSGATNAVQLLAKLGDLPAPVRILVTTREEPRVLKFFHTVTPFDLIKDADKDVDDVRTYVEGLLTKLTVVEEGKRREFGQRLSEQAAGVFLYASLVLDDLLQRQLEELPDLATYPLPKGLSGLYHEFLTRELGKDEQRWYDSFHHLLGLVSVARDPGFTGSQLQRLTGTNIEQPLRACKQYLLGELPDGPFRSFHKSFTDFLLGDKNNLHYHIDATRMHRQIVEHYRATAAEWANLDWTTVDTYGLAHLSHHLYALRETETGRSELYKLICKPLIQEKRRQFGSPQSFINDVDLAINVAAEDMSSEGWVQLVRLCLIYAKLRTQATNIPPALLGILARGGEVARALGYVELIQGTLNQITAYCLIGKTLLDAGEVEKGEQAINHALVAIEAMLDTKPKAQTLAQVAEVLAQTGYSERALVIANQALIAAEAMQEEASKARALRDIAQVLARAGDPERALIVGSQALVAAEAIQHGISKVGALRDIAQVLARAGDPERALAVAKQLEAMEDGSYITTSALGDIAQVLGQVGDSARALVVANQILVAAEAMQDKESKAQALGKVAEVLAQTGNFERALVIANDALIAAKAMQDGQVKGLILKYIAEVLAQTGNSQRAVIVAQAIQDEESKAGALRDIAEVLAQTANFERALLVANQAVIVAQAIQDQESKAQTLGKLAEVVAQTGNFERALVVSNQALIVAEAMRNGKSKVRALRGIAEVLARMGNFERASDVAHQALIAAEAIRDNIPNELALENIARVLAQAGDSERAVVVAEAIQDEELKARALAQVRDSERALVVDVAMHDRTSQAEALIDIAQLLALHGHSTQSLVVANEARNAANTQGVDSEWALALACQVLIAAVAMQYDAPKANALRGLAQLLGRAGEPERALVVANQALIIAETIQDESLKARALGDLALTLVELDQCTTGLKVLRKVLLVSRLWSYGEIARALSKGASQLASIDHGQTLWRVYEAIQEVDDWSTV